MGLSRALNVLKGEREKFSKTFFLCSNIWSSEKKVNFIYSVIMLSTQIVYHLKRLCRALKLMSLEPKAYVFLNFLEKYVSEKKINVIITIIIEYI